MRKLRLICFEVGEQLPRRDPRHFRRSRFIQRRKQWLDRRLELSQSREHPVVLRHAELRRIRSRFRPGGVARCARDSPQNMQQFTNYDDVMHEMIYYFSDKIAQAQQHGIVDVIVDPGFGFSKTLDQNYEVLNKLDLLQHLNNSSALAYKCRN